MKLVEYKDSDNITIKLTLREAKTIEKAIQGKLREVLKEEGNAYEEIGDIYSDLLEIVTHESELLNKKLKRVFRDIPAEVKRQKASIKELHFPKDWRYWYFRSNNPEHFAEWYKERFNAIERGTDIKQLVITIRNLSDPAKEPIIDVEIAKSCIDEIQGLIDQYELDYIKLEDIAGMDHLL